MSYSAPPVMLFFVGLEHTGHHFWQEVLKECDVCRDAARVRHALAALWRIMGPDGACDAQTLSRDRCEHLGCTWSGDMKPAAACSRGQGSYARALAEFQRLGGRAVKRERVFCVNVLNINGTGMMSYPNSPYWRTPDLGDVASMATATRAQLRVVVLLRDVWAMLKGMLGWAMNDRRYLGAWAYSTGRTDRSWGADAWWVEGRADRAYAPTHLMWQQRTETDTPSDQAGPLLLKAYAASARELAEQLLRLPRQQYVCIDYGNATGARLLDESLRGAGLSTTFENLSRALWRGPAHSGGEGLSEFRRKLQSSAPPALAEMLVAVRAVTERCRVDGA